MKMQKRVLAVLLVLVLIVIALPLPILNVKGVDSIVDLNELAPYKNRTAEEVALKYFEAKNDEYYNSTFSKDYYEVLPSSTAPYTGGELKEEVHQAMTDMTNFYRWLAGVNEYENVSSHSEGLQAGALIQNLYYQAEGKLTHHLDTDWTKPADMDQSFWDLGTKVNHNIIAYNYTPQGAIEGWFNEGYSIENQAFDTIGHRKALLSYTSTGANFGYAGDMVYGAITAQGTTYLPCIAYPAPGAYPSNNIDPDVTAWSVELNLNKLSYDSLNDVIIRVTNLNTKASYECRESNGKLMKSDTKGQLMFVQPTVSSDTYEDSYKVEILGLKDKNGYTNIIEYEIDFFDLNEFASSTVSHVSSDWLNVYTGKTNSSNNPSFTSLESILPSQVTIVTNTNRKEKINVEWSYNEETNEFLIKPGSYTLPNLINDDNLVLQNFAIKCEDIILTDNNYTDTSYSVNEGEITNIEIKPYLSDVDIFCWYKLLDDGTISLVNQSSKVLTIENTGLADAGQYFAMYKYSYSQDVYVTPLKTLEVLPAKTLANIEITSPNKTQYFVGQGLILDGLNVKAIYNDNSSENIDLSQVQINGFDASTPGNKIVTVTYQDKTAAFEVEIIEKEVTNIKVTQPTNIQYIEGQEIDLTGGKIIAVYNDGSSEIIDLISGEIEITGYDKFKIGSQKITVTYKNVSNSFTVNVKAKQIIDISMSNLPIETQYVKGQDIELNGGKILVRYNNGSSEEIDLTNPQVSISGYNKNKIGNQSITIRYGGKRTSFMIEVVEKVVTSISVTAPTKVQYVEGQSMDLTGATITATYNDGSVESGIVVTEDMISGYNNEIFGNQTITVTYQNQISIFNVNVRAKSIVGIEMLSNPAKLEYIEGQELDLTDAKIKVSYDNGLFEKVSVKLPMISGYENDKIGEQIITVAYGGFDTQFAVNVIEKVVTKLELAMLPNKLSYVVGQELNVEGALLKATYNDGEVRENIIVTNEMCSGFNSSNLGIKTVVVNYEEGLVQFNVNVEEKKLIGIEITPPSKSIYIEGQVIDLSGLQVKAIYNDDSEFLLDLNDVVIKGYNANEIGKQLITVEYKNLSEDFEIEVINKAAEKIEITSPLKVKYVKGQDLNLDGMEIIVTYNNGEIATLNVNDVEVSGYNANKVGKQLITVTYQGKSDTFEINVIDKIVASIYVTTPLKTEYIQGEKLDFTGATVIVNCNDNTSYPIGLSEDMISGFDTNKVGKQAVMVTFEGKTASFEVEVIAKEIIKTEITAPIKVEYIEGQELDLTGASILVTYNDNTTETVSITKNMVSGYDKNKVGKQIINVTYKNQAGTFEVNVIEKAIINVVMNSLPNKVNYIIDQIFDITGATLKVTYNSGETEIVPVTDEMFTAPVLTSIGNKMVNVTYNGFEISFNVVVRNKLLTAIEISQLPNKLEYLEGQELDVTGGKLQLTYDNGSKEIVALDSPMCKVDMDQVGDKVDVEVSYNELKTAYSIKIKAKTVILMKWIEEPEILKFKEGKSFIFSGKVELTFDNGVTDIVDVNSGNFVVQGYDKSKVGQQEVNIVYSGTNVAVKQKIEILPKISIGLAIQVLPIKTVYEIGSEFSIDGLVAVIMYDNDSTEVIPLESLIISKPDMNQLGKQIINISDGKYKTSFEIEIIKKEDIENKAEQNNKQEAVNTSDDISILSYSSTLLVMLFGVLVSLMKGKKFY